MILCLLSVWVCNFEAACLHIYVCTPHYSTLISLFRYEMIKLQRSLCPLPELQWEVWNRGGPPSLPIRVITCANVGQCLFISLTSSIKIHSANEPSLSPSVIKTYYLVHRRVLSFGSAVTPLQHKAHAATTVRLRVTDGEPSETQQSHSVTYHMF